MRYLGMLGVLIAVGLMMALVGTKLAHSPQATYNVAVGAAHRAAGAAQQHAQDVLRSVNVTKP